MSNIEILALVLGVALGIGGTVIFLFPFLKKKGVNTEEVIQKVDKSLDAANGVLTIADTLIPNNPALNTLKVVEKYARIGVDQAEQLYVSSQLPADQRNAKAKETILAALKSAGISITPELTSVIDGAIEAEVLALGHKGTQSTDDTTIVAK